MTIAIPEHEGRVAPVFDNCQKLMIFADSRLIRIVGTEWRSLPPVLRPRWLRQNGVHMLVCGGISAFLAAQVQAQGIRLASWIAGDVPDVLNACLSGTLWQPQWRMPGCRCRGRNSW